MADQKNNQSTQNTSPGQQSSSHPDGGQSSQRTQGSSSSTQRQPQRNDESTGWDESQRERSSREPVSTANDSGLGDEQRSFDTNDSAIEDLTGEPSIGENDEEDTGGSSR